MTQVVFVLGIINFLMALSIVSTCRCIPGNRILRPLTKNKAFQTINRYHCYLWWVFWPSVIVHLIFAALLIGFPF